MPCGGNGTSAVPAAVATTQSLVKMVALSDVSQRAEWREHASVLRVHMGILLQWTTSRWSTTVAS
jgi:hypothetical protein